MPKKQEPKETVERNPVMYWYIQLENAIEAWERNTANDIQTHKELRAIHRGMTEMLYPNGEKKVG